MTGKYTRKYTIIFGFSIYLLVLSLLLLTFHIGDETVKNKPVVIQTAQRMGEWESVTTSTISLKVAPKASRGNKLPRYSGPINDDIWMQLSMCEAGGRPDAVSRSGKYFGAFQFSLATWHGIGETGNPIDYSYEHQLEAAKRLQARSGWGQWPVCSRKLGLL